MSSKGKLVECLKRLGIKPKLETFGERKLLQKLVYLLQVSGVRLNFHYNWYLHGPYSPSLTRTLYEIVESGSLPHEELSNSDIARIDKLRSFLGEDINSPDRLELLVSIHYLRERARTIGASDAEVTTLIQNAKPYFSQKELEESWQKSTELDEINSFHS